MGAPLWACGCLFAGLLLFFFGMVMVLNKVIVRVRDEAKCLQQCIGASGCCTLWRNSLCWRGEVEDGGAGCKKRPMLASVPVVLAGFAVASLGVYGVAKLSGTSDAAQAAADT